MRKQKTYAILIVVVAIVATVLMIKVGRKKPKERVQRTPSAVRTILITPRSQQAIIKATAVVEANQSLSLAPEIAGRVVWVSPKVNAGGVVAKGTLLARLDNRDYKLQVKQTEVMVENAQLAMDLEEARGDVAKKEWEVLGDSSEASDLVLRVRQKEVARLDYISAQSSLEKAKLNLSRTEIRAPFDATITSKNIAVGQVVSTQAALMTMVERGDLLAEVSLPLADLPWVEVPGIGSATTGSRVVVTQELGGDKQVTRFGEVVTLIGHIDQQTRRAKLLITIPHISEKEPLPLFPGAFVNVLIQGKSVESAVAIPREAVQRGVEAWEVLADSTLQRFPLTRLWGTTDDIISATKRSKPFHLALTLPESTVEGLKVIPMEVENE